MGIIFSLQIILIYRTSNQTRILQARLLGPLKLNRTSNPYLTVEYRKAAHLNPRWLGLLGTYDVGHRQLKKRLSNGYHTSKQVSQKKDLTPQIEEDVAEVEAWEEQFKSIYEHRRWLLSFIIDAIPKSFLARSKSEWHLSIC